ncbi:MAG: methyltransferase domain-containing protein [Pseudomonadota bacterium]
MLLHYLWKLDARRKWRLISPHLPAGASVLEVGCGMGTVADAVTAQGHPVVALDVADSSRSRELKRVLYDGHRMPFRDGAFDVALILTVLHHATDPEAVLAEAGRVARRVIVMEDLVEGRWQERLTHWADSLANWEFVGHPHNNRDDRGWRETFDALGFSLLSAFSMRFFIFFRQSVYVLDRRGDACA